MSRPPSPPGRAARRRSLRAAQARPLDVAGLRGRVEAAALSGPPARTARARDLLLAWIDAASARGAGSREIARAMRDGRAAGELGAALRDQVHRAPPRQVREAACGAGCAFCCILDGEDGGTITEQEARGLHDALAPLAGRPDGRRWHPSACAALDPDTRSCRAYAARPDLCRSYFSTDAGACRVNAEGGTAAGAGMLGTHPDMLAVHGLARNALAGVARVPTYALSRLAAAAVEGRDADAALDAARQAPRALDRALAGLAASAAVARPRD